MKIGVYGGTFDPIHLAHLIIAEYAREELALDRLFFTPGYIPPHKKNADISSAAHRVAMIQCAIADNDFFDICDFEIMKKGTSYTVDTLAHIQKKYGLSHENLYFILGADNMKDFNLWKHPEKIQQMAQLVVAGRPSFEVKSNDVPFKSMDFPLFDISASLIRRRISQKKSIRYLVADKVEQYIHDNKLYM